MKLGISSYCLCERLYAGQMTIFDIMDWAKAQNCAHFELVPFGLPLMNGEEPNYELAEQIRDHAKALDLPLSAFSLNACMIRPGDDELTGGREIAPGSAEAITGAQTRAEKYAKEIERVKKYMDLAHIMGIKKMRHDTCSGQHPLGINTPEQFEEDFPVFVKAVQELADYAATLGMGTTLENHGLYVNGADRLIRILKAANRPNVGLTVDVGNYLCVDDEPEVAVAKAIQYADMVHLKDFYIRDNDKMYPQDGMYTYFAQSIPAPEGMARFGYVATASHRKILRGSIVGQGDMNMWNILRIIKQSGYDKEISLEFEGMEDCVPGTYYGLEMARYIWDRV